jgi:hypothetical protein
MRKTLAESSLEMYNQSEDPQADCLRNHAACNYFLRIFTSFGLQVVLNRKKHPLRILTLCAKNAG